MTNGHLGVMINAHLTIMIKGLDALLLKLKSIETKSKNYKPLLEKIGKDMKTKTAMNFRSQKSPDGVSWEKSKRDGQTLSDTGALRGSITYSTDSSSVAVGTNLKYATTMHYGAKKGSLGSGRANVKSFTRKNGVKVKTHTRRFISPWGNIPARPFIGIGKSMEKKYKKMIKEYIFEK